MFMVDNYFFDDIISVTNHQKTNDEASGNKLRMEE